MSDTICLFPQSLAATLERTFVFQSLILALEQHSIFAEKHQIPVQCRFPDLLIQLFSNRPSVCAEALDLFSNFRELSIRVLHEEFANYYMGNPIVGQYIDGPLVNLHVLPSPTYKGEFQLPLYLLQSICVVLSIWKEGDYSETSVPSVVISELTDALLKNKKCEENDSGGLASATLVEGGMAMSVESVRYHVRKRSFYDIRKLQMYF